MEQGQEAGLSFEQVLLAAGEGDFGAVVHGVPWLGGGVSWNRILDSQYARVIIETGLLGLAAFAFLQLQILRAVRQAYRWTDDWVGRGMAMGVFATTIGLLVHAMGTISFLILHLGNLFFWPKLLM